MYQCEHAWRWAKRMAGCISIHAAHLRAPRLSRCCWLMPGSFVGAISEGEVCSLRNSLVAVIVWYRSTVSTVKTSLKITSMPAIAIVTILAMYPSIFNVCRYIPVCSQALSYVNIVRLLLTTALCHALLCAYCERPLFGADVEGF